MKSYYQIKTDVSSTLVNQLPTVLIDLILDYYVERVSFQWEALLNNKSSRSNISYIDEQFLENYKKNFFKVLRHCEEKLDDEFTLDFLDLQGYKSAQTKKTFTDGFSALEYLIWIGLPIMQNVDVYNIKELLRTYSLLYRPPVMDLYLQLILELPNNTKFTLTKKELPIITAYHDLKGEFNPSTIFGAIDSMLHNGAFKAEMSIFPYHIVNADSITFIASPQSERAQNMIDRFSQYKQRYLSFEQKLLNSDCAEFLTQYTPLPPTLTQIISQYIPDISSSAQNLLTQLEDLEKRYSEEFTDLFCPEGLRIFKDALKAAVAKRLLYVNNSDFERKYEGAQDPILVISRLIEGVLLEGRYSFSSTMFNLLDFFKNFNLYNGQPLGEDVEKFLLDLLELTDSHQPLVISRKLFQGFVRKKVSGLFLDETNSSRNWNQALEKINLRLFTHNEYPCTSLVNDPVSFMTLNDTEITLYIKKQAVITISQLMELATTTSIHLSSLFVQQLLSKFSTVNMGSSKVITDLMAAHFQVTPETIQSISHFGIYGYKATITHPTYSKIQRTCEESARLFTLPPQEQKLISKPIKRNPIKFFINKIKEKSPRKATTLSNPPQEQKLISEPIKRNSIKFLLNKIIKKSSGKTTTLFNPPPEQKRLKKAVEHAILKSIEPLEKDIHSYGDKEALMKQWIESFNKSLNEKFANIHNPETALKVGHTFLEEWTENFNKLMDFDTNNEELYKNATQIFEEMIKLTKDISALMQDLTTGEISLAVEVLPTSKPSELGIY
jgi:hypothetical protein